MLIPPDGRITKVVLDDGDWGKKPAEASECKVIISDCDQQDLLQYNSTLVIIGDSDNFFKRTLDICLMSMNEKEVATFTISPPENLTFTVQLVDFKFHGLIYQWSVQKKLLLTLGHKEKGVELFKLKRYKDAAYCFTKALKIVLSIPIDAENPPKEIDGVSLEELNLLKANLYNNLASFYLKFQAWQMVVDLCRKVFLYESDNVKAHYKIAVALMHERSFEEAQKEFNFVLEFEPNNSAAIEHLKNVKSELQRSNESFNSIVKKMFQ